MKKITAVFRKQRASSKDCSPYKIHNVKKAIKNYEKIVCINIIPWLPKPFPVFERILAKITITSIPYPAQAEKR
jgi:hypothetical protein